MITEGFFYSGKKNMHAYNNYDGRWNVSFNSHISFSLVFLAHLLFDNARQISNYEGQSSTIDEKIITDADSQLYLHNDDNNANILTQISIFKCKHLHHATYFVYDYSSVDKHDIPHVHRVLDPNSNSLSQFKICHRYNIVSWEPEGRYQYSKTFRWQPEGRLSPQTLYSDYIAPFCMVLNGTSLNINTALLALNWP